MHSVFDRLFASQTTADLGVYAAAGIVFVSALNACAADWLATEMTPSVVVSVLGLLFYVTSGGEQARDLPLGAFVLLLIPALTLPLAGFALGFVVRFVRVRVTD